MPKTKYTKELILETAIKMAKEEGIESLNVRKIASMLGCSVAPIYTAYQNFENLIKEVDLHYRNILSGFVVRKYSHNEFFNMGLGLVDFTIRYPKIYMYLYKNTDDFFDILKQEANLMDMMEESHLSQLLDTEELKYLLDSMSTFTQGLCMSIVLKPDSLSLKDAIDKLDKVGGDLTQATLERKGVLSDYQCKQRGKQE